MRPERHGKEGVVASNNEDEAQATRFRQIAAVILIVAMMVLILLAGRYMPGLIRGPL